MQPRKNYFSLIFRITSTILWLAIGSYVAAFIVGAIRMNAELSNVPRYRATGDIHFLDSQLRIYNDANGAYPTTEQGLQAFVAEPRTSPRPQRWRRLADGIMHDEWGSEYIYRCPGLRHPDGYDLYSAGPDHKPDTADDVWGDWTRDTKWDWIPSFFH
jgi:general secretion pathway protein G